MTFYGLERTGMASSGHESAPYGHPNVKVKSTPRPEHLFAIAEHLGPDELAVLTFVAERLRSERSTYGELHLATDTRNFTREVLEEAADMALYAAVGSIIGWPVR